MLIIDQPALLFVHIPKTAGTSVNELIGQEAVFNPLCLKGTKHESLEEFQNRCGEEILSKFHIFTIVRNPLERFISHYRWLQSRQERFPEMAQIDSLDSFARAYEGNYGVGSKRKRVMCQSDYLLIDGKMRIDTILRFENLPHSLLSFLREFGIQKSQMPTRNAATTSVPNPSSYVRSFIADYYEKDYINFNYTLP